MKADDLFEAIGRGIVKQLLANDLAPEPALSPGATLPAESGPPGDSKPPEAPSIIQADLPTPSFDLVDEPLPGFESIPPATLRDMQAAMDRITKGDTIPPGFYDKDTADTSVPLS